MAHEKHHRRGRPRHRAGLPPGPATWALSCCFCVFLASVAVPAAAETSIYFYRDENGVTHFTNRPNSSEYKLFAIFGSKGKADVKEIERLAHKYGAEYGFDGDFILAVIEVESNYDHRAISHAGAEGLMQLMPGTQQDLGVNAAFDPEANIEAGCRYLREQYERFGDVRLALAAYNAGPGAVEKYKGVPPYKETQGYVKKVIARYRNRKGK